MSGSLSDHGIRSFNFCMEIKKEESYMESKDNFEFPIDNSISVTEWINFTTWTGKKICPFTYDEQRR